jgi:clan AA aspartic protease
MGYVYADIEIVNPSELEMARRHIIGQEEVKQMRINVLVDSGAYLLCINENIQAIFDFPFVKKERLELADGSIEVYDIVGPIEIIFADQKTCCNAFVLPGSSKPLLGAVPMELLNLVLHPLRQKLVVDTELPMLPSIRPLGILK